MTQQEKIDAILSAVQNDVKLLTLLRAAVAKNLPNVPDQTLDTLLVLLGIV